MHIEKLNGGFAPPAARLPPQCFSCIFCRIRIYDYEKSGMNFSEYMALLSGNTDLLDKAKLEKRIASLEGERKSFNKGRRDSEFKLESKTGELRNNTAMVNAMTEDWNRFLSVVQTDKEGNRLNHLRVDGVDSAD